MKLGRWVTVALAFALSLVTGGSVRAAASDYPSHPITILVPFAAGSTVDVEARTLALALRDRLHQPVVVADAPGGSGGVSLEQLESRPADGYTFLLTTRTLSFLLASGEVKYTAADIIGVMRLNGEAAGLFVKADSPFKTLPDLVKFAKANPGKLSFGGPETVSINHQVETEFADLAGFKANWVPFNGGSEVVTNVLGGHVDAGIAAASNALSSVQGGSMRYLALAAKHPYAPYPQAPTFDQSGYPIVEYVWRGFIAKAGTPPAALAAFAGAVNAVRATPDWTDFLKKDSQVDLYMDTAAFQAYLTKEIADTVKLAKRLQEESK